MSYLFGKRQAKRQLKEFNFLSELENIHQVDKSFPVLKPILRKLKIAYTDFHIVISNSYRVRISSDRVSKIHKVQSFRDNKELIAYIQADPWGKNIEEYPDELRSYLMKKNTYCVIPILFRSMLLGIFAFPSELKKRQIQIFESIARRLSLIIHNQLLDDKINLSREVEKSFLIARKMEFFLEANDRIKMFDYEVEKIKHGWHTKYFPVYYEVKEKGMTDSDKKQKSYVILCRPSKNLHKGAIISLCLIQGYFVSLCESSSNLIKLSSRLHGVIKKTLKQQIYLEGFILLLRPEGIRIHYFGKQLEMLKDSKKFPFTDSSPLGSNSWDILNVTRVKFEQELTLLIRNYPLIKIKKRAKAGISEHNFDHDSVSILSKLPESKLKFKV